MAVQEVQAYVYVCDGCNKKVLAASGEVPDGISGAFTETNGESKPSYTFFACRKTHVAKAIKNVLTAASGEATQPWTGQAPDPTSSDSAGAEQTDPATGTESGNTPADEGATSGESSAPPNVEGDDTAESAKPPGRRGRR